MSSVWQPDSDSRGKPRPFHLACRNWLFIFLQLNGPPSLNMGPNRSHSIHLHAAILLSERLRYRSHGCSRTFVFFFYIKSFRARFVIVLENIGNEGDVGSWLLVTCWGCGHCVGSYVRTSVQPDYYLATNGKQNGLPPRAATATGVPHPPSACGAQPNLNGLNMRSLRNRILHKLLRYTSPMRVRNIAVTITSYVGFCTFKHHAFGTAVSVHGCEFLLSTFYHDLRYTRRNGRDCPWRPFQRA
jgi:hypothetical protein